MLTFPLVSGWQNEDQKWEGFEVKNTLLEDLIRKKKNNKNTDFEAW
jgi:hypothetical protein